MIVSILHQFESIAVIAVTAMLCNSFCAPELCDAMPEPPNQNITPPAFRSALEIGVGF